MMICPPTTALIALALAGCAHDTGTDSRLPNMNKVTLIRRESSGGETDVKGGSFTVSGVGSEPFEVARAASGEGPDDKFGSVIRMRLQDMVFQFS